MFLIAYIGTVLLVFISLIKQTLSIFILPKLDLIKKIIIIKFLICSSFLLLMRGGTPRYRYDYLTKIGWLKFLFINIWVIISTVLNLTLY